jgi:hypothetical protein
MNLKTRFFVEKNINKIITLIPGGRHGGRSLYDDQDDRLEEEVPQQVHLRLQPGQLQLGILLR